MIKSIHKTQPFYKSILLGILVWLIILLIVPATSKYPFLLKNKLFIVINLFTFIVGYAIIPLKQLKIKYKPNNKMFINVLLFFLIVYMIRYYDLFILREAKISLSTSVNRQFLKEGLKYNNIFTTIATIFKSLYFVPLVFYFQTQNKNKSFLIASLLFFILPFPEAIIRGSRNQIFESLILLLFILFYFRKIKPNYKTGLIILFLGIFMLVSSSKMLYKREGIKRMEYSQLVSKDVIYNQLLVPKPWVYNKIKAVENIELQKILISIVQIGQYYSHSVYEFNYVMNNYKADFQYGKYNFQVLCKFGNHYNLTHFNLKNIEQSSPRRITYITLFGAGYIDFGWFSFLIFFALGLLQKFIYNRTQNGFIGIIYTWLMIFFLYANFFLFTVNFYNSLGLYTIFALIFILLSLKLFTFVSTKLILEK